MTIERSTRRKIGVPDRLREAVAKYEDDDVSNSYVMTGMTDAKTLEASPVRPHHVLRSIADLEGLLRENQEA